MSSHHHTALTGLVLTCALLALTLAGTVRAQPAPEAAPIFFTHDDPTLEWGPCPDFLPEGCGLAVLQGDPEGHNADVFFRVPAGADLPHHWHTSAERMILVSGELHLTYDGQDTHVMRPGSYAYGPARLAHEGHCAEGPDPCILFIAFEQPVDAIPTDAAAR
ncbi:MAG: cupin domain-containing protein [Gammaproteobacteria bacterium]|nr:cupin domain-containing protein [Gammaproteobacteria bacterium]